MYLTMDDICMLTAGITVSAYITYVFHEVMQAIISWYEEW